MGESSLRCASERSNSRMRRAIVAIACAAAIAPIIGFCADSSSPSIPDFGDEYQSLPLSVPPTVPVSLGGSNATRGSGLPSVPQAIEYSRLIRGQHATGPIDSSLFGESVDYFTGQTDFATTDVSLPGSSVLPVSVGRRYQVRNRATGRPRGMFGDWDIDLPHVEGIVATSVGWTVPAVQHDARCTYFGAPPSANVTTQTPSGPILTQVPAGEYGTGFSAYIPGYGRRELLLRDLDAPAPSGPHPVITKDLWAVSCVERNSTPVPGQPDEGFVITTPNGVTYTFTQGFVRDYAPLERPADTAVSGVTAVVERQEIWLLPTKIEDRFGNSVVFAYQYGSWGGIELKYIEASDGRRIDLVWNGGYVKEAKDGDRTWRYQYNSFNELTSVTQPDGAKWIIDFAALNDADWSYTSPTCQSLPSPSLSQAVSGTLKHPARGTAKFTFEVERHGRSGAPTTCLTNSANIPFARSEPAVYDVLSLTKKEVSGAGISGTYTWKLEYDGCTANACATEQKTILTDARGFKTQFTFGSGFGELGEGNEGVLLRKQSGGSGTTYLRDEQYEYFDTNGNPYPTVMGTPAQVRGDDSGLGSLRPIKKKTVSVNDEMYTLEMSDPDDYGFPKTIVRNGSESKTDTLTYAHNTNDWVLGTVRKIQSDSKVELELTLDSHNQPKEVRRFTRLEGKFDYYSDGLLKWSEDGNLKRTTYSNYRLGIPRSVVHPGSETESVVVDDLGAIRSHTDEMGKVTSYDYDDMGRLKSITPAGGYNATNITWSHGNDGYNRETTKGTASLTVKYDAFLRPIETIDNIDRRTKREFDAEGRLTFESYPDGLVGGFWKGVTNEYDALGRLQKQTDGESRQTTYAWIGNDELRVKNRNGHNTTYRYLTYDEPSSSWPVRIETPNSVTLVERDTWGKVKKIRRGIVERKFEYFSNQRLQTITEPETGVTSFTYDGAGNIATVGHDGSATETRTYDGRNRLTGISWSDTTPSSVFVWRKDGQPDTATLGLVERKYDYNTAGLLTGERVTIAGATYEIGYDYDLNRNLKTLTYPDNVQIELTPDEFGRPSKVGTFATSIQYHSNDAVKQFTYGNGKTHALTQTVRGLPHVVTEPGIMNATHGYDNATNPTSRTDSLGSSWTLTYDDGERLKTATGPWGTSTYTYDDRDNLTGDTAPGATLTIDSFNRIDKLNNSPVIWDSRGRLKQRPGLETKFDASNRLIEAKIADSTWTYAYDAWGNRVRAHRNPNQALIKTTITSIYDSFGKLAYEVKYVATDATLMQEGEVRGPMPVTTSTKYIYLGDHLVAKQAKKGLNSNTTYQHTDALGSPVAQTNASGQVVSRTTYSPYGILHSATQVEDGPGYAGRYDDATGLIYMHHRYYDPELRRFISPDPVGVDPASGVNFNRYAYANNSPYRFYDPSGRSSEEEDEDEVEEAEQDEASGEPTGDGAGGETTNDGSDCPPEVADACEDRARLLGGIRELQTSIGEGVEVADAVTTTVAQEVVDPTTYMGSAAVKAISNGITFLKGALAEKAVLEAVGGAAGTLKGLGNIGSHGVIDAGTALGAGQKWLGAGYKEIAPGVFRSADGLRQFRMTNADILGSHGEIGSHVHFEALNDAGKVIENLHLPVTQ